MTVRPSWRTILDNVIEPAGEAETALRDALDAIAVLVRAAAITFVLIAKRAKINPKCFIVNSSRIVFRGAR